MVDVVVRARWVAKEGQRRCQLALSQRWRVLVRTSSRGLSMSMEAIVNIRRECGCVDGVVEECWLMDGEGVKMKRRDDDGGSKEGRDDGALLRVKHPLIQAHVQHPPNRLMPASGTGTILL